MDIHNNEITSVGKQTNYDLTIVSSNYQPLHVDDPITACPYC